MAPSGGILFSSHHDEDWNSNFATESTGVFFDFLLEGRLRPAALRAAALSSQVSVLGGPWYSMLRSVQSNENSSLQIHSKRITR
jgi:hypothetical protein